MTYIIVEIPASLVKKLGLLESIWKQSDYPDYLLRMDAGRPEIKILSHVHIAHKKHINTTTKQVSWNDDATKHDKGNFDHGFKGMEKAKEIAKTALKLGDDVILEWATPIYKAKLLAESALGKNKLTQSEILEVPFPWFTCFVVIRI
jgi:hypothetical protein